MKIDSNYIYPQLKTASEIDPEISWEYFLISGDTKVHLFVEILQ